MFSSLLPLKCSFPLVPCYMTWKFVVCTCLELKSRIYIWKLLSGDIMTFDVMQIFAWLTHAALYYYQIYLFPELGLRSFNNIIFLNKYKAEGMRWGLLLVEGYKEHICSKTIFITQCGLLKFYSYDNLLNFDQESYCDRNWTEGELKIILVF